VSASRKLSSDEVNALIEGLQESSSASSGIDLADSEIVRPFSFGSDDLSVLGDYYALRMINERFARLARSIFLPMLRIPPRISSFPPEVKSFDDYCSGIDSFMSLSTARIEELRGSLLMVHSPNFISVLTNSYYGGNLELVKNSKNKKQEFTATEERMIEIVVDGLNQTLEKSWSDLTKISIIPQGREVNPQFASFVEGSDMVIICSFVVQLPKLDPATFDIIYPLQTLKPIASQLRSRVRSDIIDDDATWREKIEKAVLGIPLSLDARLGSPVVPLNKLIYLKAGDVIPITLTDSVELFLENKRFYGGEMGEVAGQSAVSLTHRLNQEV